MADTYDVLVVAYYLAFLTFYTGVLIYALPIPWRGLKSWAPRLIGDSLFAVVLISSYLVLVKSTDYLLGILGGSWDAFWSWVSSALAFVTTAKTLVISLLAAAKSVNASWILSSITWPIDRVINLVIIVVATLSGLGWLVTTYRDLFIALGIVLMSIPLRIGRGAGAWLIAFSIVFYVGLPLLPTFSAWLAEAPSSSEDLGFTIAKARILDYSGDRVDLGVLILTLTPGGDPVAVYPVSGGVIQGKLGPGYISFPSNVDVYAMLELDGVWLPLDPYPFSSSQLGSPSSGSTLDLTAVNLAYSDGLLAVFTSSSLVSVALEVGRSNITLYTWAPQSYYVEIRYPDGCNVDVSHTAASVEDGTWDWRGVSGAYMRLYSNNGSMTVTIAYGGSCSPQFNAPETQDYLLDSRGAESLIDTKMITDIVLYYLTIPLMYNLTLASMAYALARVLGGRDRIMPRFI